MASDLNCDIQKLNDPLLKNGEKLKMINNIVNKLKQKQYIQNQIDEFLKIDTLKNSTIFVKRLYVNFLNEMKNDEIVIEALLSEDEQLIDNIIKRCDFFWSNEKYTLEFYSSKIFPRVSYSQRNRILKSIEKNIKNPECALKYFNNLTVLYCVQLARPFLKRCSYEAWIKAIEYNIYLGDNDFKHIFKNRSSDILKYYQHLTELITNKKTSDQIHDQEYSETIVKLILLYPDEIIKILDIEKNFFSFKANKKITKLFIKNHLDFLISDITSDRYNRVVLYKYLTKEQLQTIICKFFPEDLNSVSDFIPRVNYLLDPYWKLFKKSEIKLEFFQKCFQHVYGEELLENKKNITTDLLEWIEDNEMRHKYAMEGFQMGDQDRREAVDYIPYMKIDVSIRKLKELAQTTNDSYDREKYLADLIRTCEINNDYDALLEVLKYLNTKHKNERFIVRNRLISQLQDSFNDKLSTFKTEHWDEIYNMICNFDLKSELNECSYINVNLFIESFKYLEKNVIKSKFENWFNLFKKWCTSASQFESNLEDLENKQILLWASEFVEDDYAQSLLTIVTDYNAKQKKKKSEEKDLINIKDWKWALCLIEDRFTTLKKIYIPNEFETFISILEKDDGVAKYYSEKIIELKREYLEKSEFDNLNYIIQYMPEGVDIIPNILPKLLDGYIKYLKSSSSSISFKNKINKANELKRIPGMEKILHEKYFEILRNKNSDHLKEYALWILYPHLSNTEFFEIIKPYYPKEKDASIGSDESQYKFMLQKRIAYCLKDFRSDEEALNALKAFCLGDFLPLTIGSLNCICQKIPFYKSKEFLENSTNVPVSFKKHVLRLLSILLEKSSVIKIFEEFWSKEKNPTIRKIVLEKMLKYLKTEYDITIWWEKIVKCIEELDHKDKDIFEILTNLKDIPKIYLTAYFELVWKKILEIEKEVPELKENCFEMLDTMNNNIIYLKDDFIKELLNEYLFDINSERFTHLKFCETAVRYILLKEEEEELILTHRLKIIIEKLQNSFQKNWNTYDEDEEQYKLRVFVSDFGSVFIKKIIQMDIKEKETVKFIITNFDKMLKESFNSDTYFYSYYLHFDFILIYYDVERNAFEFGKAVRNIIDREIEKYESIAAVNLAKELEMFKVFAASFELINSKALIDGILHEPIQSSGCVLTAYYLINLHDMVDEREKHEFNELLLNTNDKHIKLYLNNVWVPLSGVNYSLPPSTCSTYHHY